MLSFSCVADDVHASQQLFSTIQGCTQALEKLSDECIAVLRGEMQVRTDECAGCLDCVILLMVMSLLSWWGGM